MRQRPSRSAADVEWPPNLRHLLRAAALECPAGHADALAALTALALRKIPARGLFDPAIRAEEDLLAAIERVANEHFALADARADWRRALDAAALPFETRDEIEHAALRAQTIAETTYFYAGLAFGLTFTSAYRAP